MPAAGQRWSRVASAPPGALRRGGRRSRRARVAAAALNGSVLVLANARRLALSSATGLLALSSVALGTYAGFSAQVSNPGNTFATGSVAISATVGSPSVGDAVHPVGGTFGFGTISDLLPGEPIVRYLDIENTGTLPVAIAMTSAPVTGTAGASGSQLNADASNGLKLEIKRCSGAAWTAPDACPTFNGSSTLYDGTGTGSSVGGPIAPLVDPADSDAVVSLGTVYPGAANSGHYQLRATLESTATSLTSQSSTLQFTWTASNTTS
jgi:hypothetical protein